MEFSGLMCLGMKNIGGIFFAKCKYKKSYHSVI